MLFTALFGFGTGIQASVKPMTRTVTLVGTLSLLASPTLASTLKSASEYLMLNRRSTMDSALSEAYFSQHAAFALDVRRSAPWEVSDAIFEEYVLPHCVLDEPRRESSDLQVRQRLRRLCLPLVADASTPLESAMLLNEKIWSELNVTFQPNMSPMYLSPEDVLNQGAASCSGLSIVAIDCCRAVGVPARAVGVADWGGGEGNHVWFEVWSQGAWHYLGAAEPTAANATWFTERLQQAEGPTVLASVFSRGAHEQCRWFPLPWRAAENNECHAVEVTQRYRGM